MPDGLIVGQIVRRVEFFLASSCFGSNEEARDASEGCSRA
jgi:hypothetical protein